MGLGNPGSQYAGTRHNVGADVIDVLAARHKERLRPSRREHSLVAEAHVGGRRLALACPQTYMNESGRALPPLLRRFGIEDLGLLVVVHDELDLPTGGLRIKAGGGLAGHNGLRSIKAYLHAEGFTRVRLGIGKPPGGADRGAQHVLASPSKRDRSELAVSVQLAADAVEMILLEGVAAAQNRFNN